MYVSCSVMSDSLKPHGLSPTRPLCPWGFAGKITGAGCHFFHQGIFPTRRLNPGLLHCRKILYHLSPHMHSLPYYQYPPPEGIFVTTDEPTLTHYNHPLHYGLLFMLYPLWVWTNLYNNNMYPSSYRVVSQP